MTSPPGLAVRLPGILIATLALLAGGALAAPGASAVGCGGADQPVYHVVNPGTGASLYSTSTSEVSAATGFGFTDNRGVAFHAATSATATSSTPLRRMYRGGVADFVWVTPGEVASAAAAGYVDQGVDYYVAAVDDACLVPVSRYLRNGYHRFAATQAQRDALSTAGWTDEGTRFYAAPGVTAPAPEAPPPDAPANGAVALGSARYPVPAGAVVVAPGGSDTAAGTLVAPLRTLTAAVGRAQAGGTVVLRAGSYNTPEVTVPAGKPVVIQNYPGEAVWLDGATTVTGFVAAGNAWRKDGWTASFDSSPTYTWGAPDGTTANWQFVNPSYPLAARPDMVWLNGTELRQVASRAAVVAGTFYVDYAADQLFVGSDPTGRTVLASNQAHALRILADGTTIRGIGVRRYANSVPHQGAVTSYAKGTTVENVVIADNATGGLGIFRSGGRVRSATIVGNGQIGLQAYQADDLVLDNLRVTGNNDERFNVTPSAGGVKVTTSRGLTLSSSTVSGNIGNGFWVDQSTYDLRVVSNTLQDNTNRGIFVELSSLGTVADNLVTGSGAEQVTIRNSDRLTVWNNTIAGRTVALEFTQDARTPTNSRYATDPRRPFPDPEMTFVSAGNTVANNVLQAGSGTTRVFSVEDFTGSRNASTMVTSANGDVFSQPTAGSPTWVVVWSRAGANPYVYTRVADFRSGQGQEASGYHLVGGSALDGGWRLTAAISALEPTIARPLPSAVASLVGRPVGTRHVGAWR